MSDISQIIKALVDFRDARDWKQFHDSKNLATALSIEVAELNEHIGLASNDAKAGKRIVFANGGEKAAVAAISEVASNSIVTLPGFNGLITQVDVGGVRPETM